jgi:hypothetical protein
MATNIDTARARIDAKLQATVRAKLNDETARRVRWQDNRDGSQTPVWITMRPTAARALGLIVSSQADDYGPEPEY